MDRVLGAGCSTIWLTGTICGLVEQEVDGPV
jgi:hypothetical protein